MAAPGTYHFGGGHEIDWTIADLVADFRAPTPTAAAEWAVTRLGQIQQDLKNYCERLVRFAQQRLESPRRTLSFLHQRLVDPRKRLADLRLLVDDRFARLHWPGAIELSGQGKRLGGSSSTWHYAIQPVVFGIVGNDFDSAPKYCTGNSSSPWKDVRHDWAKR